eukprot:CAMPEP_0176347442 /NCGR_PEP_ID=MMETSP0126-20121128/7061_1 /TAXON_ID=141414 ORGANISM="Strombidinopsis acuminatum, Strain SPMC142" /NCGR_SAMPLE_ID=MMETSP0126 /ASSEMBLY_ACC=CAM_ASM_000229 /LENGTH=97 /DNA_ID=CAMNT_0017695621 /DNA_START=1811 /DNA_END=2104 /DNA_ORIENTATION=-
MTSGDLMNKEKMETIKQGQINSLKQKHTQIGQEAVRNWSAIVDDTYIFDLEVRLIEAIEKVTVEDLERIYKTMIFENPRRINLRMYSQKHLEDKELI